MSEQVFSHKPVLLDECIEALAIRPEGVYLDGTLGRAGHSREIVRRLTTGRLICVDRDQAALDAAEEGWRRGGSGSPWYTAISVRWTPSWTGWAWTGWTACSLIWGCPPPVGRRLPGLFL